LSPTERWKEAHLVAISQQDIQMPIQEPDISPLNQDIEMGMQVTFVIDQFWFQSRY
jgi:hypothetical protein